VVLCEGADLVPEVTEPGRVLLRGVMVHQVQLGDEFPSRCSAR
jgi:hypothetical protein